MSRVCNNIITFLVCFSIFFSLFTPLKAFISGGQAVTLLLPILAIFFFDKMYLRRQIVLVLLIILAIVLLRMGGVEYFENGYIPDCLILLLGVLALEHYLISKDDKYLKWVLITE